MALTLSIEGKGLVATCDAISDTSGGTWSEQGGGTISVSTDVFFIRSASIGGKYATKSGFHQYDIGSGNELDFSSGGTEEGELFYIWVSMTALGTLDTLANYGLCVRLSSSSPGTTNYIDYLIAGNDDKNGWNGGFKCFVIDPNKTASRVSGTQSTIIASVRTMGIWIDCSTSARADSIFVNEISVGSGIRVTGTSTTGWQDIVDYCTDYGTRGWGMFQEREGVAYQYGITYVGDTAQAANVSFEDSGKVIQYGISEYYSSGWITSLSAGASGIIIEDHASYTTKFVDGVIVGTDNGRSGSQFLGDSAIDGFMDLYGGNNAGSETLLYGTTIKKFTGVLNSGNDAGHKFLGVSFVQSSQFDPVGAPIIRNCTFAETVDIDSALLWNESINIQLCSFIANTLGAAIEHALATGDPYSYTDLLFSDNTFDGLNTSGSDITVNKTGTSNPINDEGANTITYSASVLVEITVQDEDKNLIENAQTAVYLLSDNTQVMNEDTTALGVASESFAGTTPVDVVIKVRKAESTDNPKYYGFSDTAIIASSTGLKRTVTLKEK